jgi:hypothetical protein
VWQLTQPLLAKSALPFAPPPPPPVVDVPPPPAGAAVVVCVEVCFGTEPIMVSGFGATVPWLPQPARTSTHVARITGRARISGRVYSKASVAPGLTSRLTQQWQNYNRGDPFKEH